MNKPIQEDTTKAANAQKTRKSSECLRAGRVGVHHQVGNPG